MPPGVTILGLGPGDPDLITRRAWEALVTADEVYLRTGGHPARSALPPGLRATTFDDLYEQMDDFERVYHAIVDRLLELARRPEGVVYAVPGDPAVGEAAVERLRTEAQVAGLPCTVIPGVSFVEPCLALLQVDMLDGVYVGDALEVAARNHPPFPPDAPALLAQLHSRLLAADLKLVLLNQYPEDHPVRLVRGAGGSGARVDRMRLFELDRSEGIDDVTALFLPPLEERSAFESFQDTVARLRAPDGCPWDREQTHASLRPHLLEEAYEALQAIDAGDLASLREELGDLLLQIVLQAQIATEEDEFRMAEVIAGINQKLVRRHPHVFGDAQVSDVDEVLHNWESLKAAERAAEGREQGALDGVPAALPGLAQALELQDRAARVGFDWPEVEGVLDKIAEELEEVGAAVADEERSSELGDLLFAVVNYARWLDVDPEASLRQANQRFRSRFSKVEAAARAEGRMLTDMTIEELNRLWEAAKAG